MTKGPLREAARKSAVRMPIKFAAVMMLVYIALGSVCTALGVLLVIQALDVHAAGRVVTMTLTSGIVVILFGVWRIALSLYHLVRIRKQMMSRR
jgi:uncharacterized membrane protein